MKKINGIWLSAGLTAAVLAIAGSLGPAHAQCIMKHPIFGVDVYMEDKYCPKKVVKKKAVITKKPNVTARRKPRQARVPKQALAAKPEKRILEMQTMLSSMGYNPGPVDGFDGPMTRKAAGEFNVANGLPKKASIGSTLAVLRALRGSDHSAQMAMPATVAPPKAVMASAPAPAGDARVLKMQTLLAGMGYNPGPADGVIKPATQKAAGEFNVANGLPKKASIGSTLAVLAGLTGK